MIAVIAGILITVASYAWSLISDIGSFVLHMMGLFLPF
jgi:hypothetical protein